MSSEETVTVSKAWLIELMKGYGKRRDSQPVVDDTLKLEEMLAALSSEVPSCACKMPLSSGSHSPTTCIWSNDL